MKKILLLLFAAFAFCGCATRSIPLAPSALENFRGKTIICAVPPPPSFEAMHGGKSLLGRAVGGLAQTIKGDQLIRDSQTQDPAKAIGSELAGELAAAYNLTVLPPLQRGQSKACNADLVLETRTTYWGFCYFLTDWKRYFVTYRSAIRLIDPKTGTCLAAGEVLVDSRDYAKPLSYEELADNQADGLKAELKTAQEKSASEFRQKILRPGFLRGAGDNR
ncbi:MAG: hypothetical protein IT583_02130 [Verrucomicrobia bacterium]|nr:hypothetical protein [Verrucomicrobiota bacterium]